MKKQRPLETRKKRVAIANAGIQTFVMKLQAQGLKTRLLFAYMLIFKRFKSLTVKGREEAGK
jgi:hypothetical protein